MSDVAIIGGGLAGTACAHMLTRAGVSCTIYEAGDALASGASGNELGLYNPRLAAEVTPESSYFMSAYDQALSLFAALVDEGGADIDFRQHGALHLITDKKRDVRYRKMIEAWGWGHDRMRLVSSDEASVLAGVGVAQEALYLPESGSVSPRKLCLALSRGADVRLNARVEDLSALGADIVILACGMASAGFAPLAGVPLKAVRGQITYAGVSDYSAGLKTALCYGGYCAPALDGRHVVGASFQRWLDHSDILPQDDVDNLDRLECFVPGMGRGMSVAGQRAAVRTTVPDHFPVVGQVDDGVYVSTAHGSHGIISSVAAADLITSMILGRDPVLPHQVIERLAPGRYTRSPDFGEEP